MNKFCKIFFYQNEGIIIVLRNINVIKIEVDFEVFQIFSFLIDFYSNK